MLVMRLTFDEVTYLPRKLPKHERITSRVLFPTTQHHLRTFVGESHHKLLLTGNLPTSLVTRRLT